MAQDSSRPDAAPPKEAGFDYAQHFGTMRTIGELVRDPAERSWTTAMPREPEHHRYVVWLGCNIIRTAHIAETLSDILKKIGVDFVALGGPSHCCGIVHQRNGDAAVGSNMLRQTMRKFDVFSPEQLLNWCPSCDGTLRKTPSDDLTDTAKGRASVTVFLASQIDRFVFEPVKPARVAIHAHAGFAEQDADGAAARTLLQHIPGVEVVDMPSVDDYDRHCSDDSVNKHGKPAYVDAVHRWIDAARRLGADQIVSIYHSCHRQMLLAQADFPPDARLDVTNYLTLIARGLALPEREDKFARFSRYGDVDAIMEDVAPNLSTLGIDAEKARASLKVQFG